MAEQEHAEDLRAKTHGHWLRLVLIIVLLLPLITMFFIPLGPLSAALFWWWFFLLVSLWIGWRLLARSGKAAAVSKPDEHLLADSPAPIHEVMDVQAAVEKSGVLIFRGPLREPAGAAFARLKAAFGEQSMPFLQPDEKYGTTILVMPKPVERARLERRSHPWVNWLLLIVTLLTTTFAGAMQQGVNLLHEPARFAVGLPYAIGLMAILGVHELGHFFAARHHGLDVTPPYFIPVPFALGTFGAFIKMRSPAEDRCSLFDVAVAGPLAGLAVAVPAVLIGLHSSVVIPGALDLPRGPLDSASVGSSILFALLAKLALGRSLLEGSALRLSPLAFAGWLGLVITALNLLPIGQLDGGHTARSMFGTRVGRIISSVGMWSLFLCALFLWPSLMVWAVIVFFLAGNSTPPQNDVTTISPGRMWLGCLAFVILALILIPLPMSWWHGLGIYNPRGG